MHWPLVHCFSHHQTCRFELDRLTRRAFIADGMSRLPWIDAYTDSVEEDTVRGSPCRQPCCCPRSRSKKAYSLPLQKLGMNKTPTLLWGELGGACSNSAAATACGALERRLPLTDCCSQCTNTSGLSQLLCAEYHWGETSEHQTHPVLD